MDKDNAIIVFARHPTPGQVKTRLAAGVGNDGAARFYKNCAEKVIQECLGTAAAIYIFFSIPEEEQEVRTWLAPLDKNKSLQYMPQIQSPNLGVRLADAFQRIFSVRKHRRVIVTGTDVPGLDTHHFNIAFQELEQYDTVFGPAKDGGYYLCALKKPLGFLPESTHPCPSLQKFFENINWSTETVLKQNVDNAIQLGFTVAPLDTLLDLWDIDTIEDLKNWHWMEKCFISTGMQVTLLETGLFKVASEVLEQAEGAE